jgi:hypothetical protein
MKNRIIIGILLVLFTLPLNGLISSGIKGGTTYQMFGNDESFKEWWYSFGLLAELNFPVLPLSVRGELGYAWYIKTGRNIMYSDMNFTLSVKYTLTPPLMPIDFYLGAGPGLHIYKVEEQETKNYFGAHIYSGLGIKMGMNIFAEAGFGMIFPEEGSWNQINLKAGLMF